MRNECLHSTSLATQRSSFKTSIVETGEDRIEDEEEDGEMLQKL